MLVDEVLAVAQQGAVEVDVLLCRELHVKARAKLDERGDGALDANLACGGLEHARDDLEHGGLAGAVGAHKAKGLAALDFKRDVVEGAELLEGELVLGRGDEVLLQGVELLGRDVEDH